MVDVQRFENRGLNPNAHRFAVGAHVNESGVWNQGVRGLVDEARIRRGLVPLEEMLDRPYDAASVDVDGDGVPDECETGDCAGDLDGDGVVGGGDLGILFVQWGGPGSADLDGDGTVSGDRRHRGVAGKLRPLPFAKRCMNEGFLHTAGQIKSAADLEAYFLKEETFKKVHQPGTSRIPHPAGWGSMGSVRSLGSHGNRRGQRLT